MTPGEAGKAIKSLIIGRYTFHYFIEEDYEEEGSENNYKRCDKETNSYKAREVQQTTQERAFPGLKLYDYH